MRLFSSFYFLFIIGCLFITGCQSSATSPEGFDPPTSGALPAGMNLVWEDDFNSDSLDRSKWSTNYYSIWDFMDRTNYEDFRADRLPQPAMEFTGHSLILRTDDQYPERAYWPSGRKISSIQTYDWNADRNFMDNRKGGFFEARIRRSATRDAKQVNGAFWFDSPGPDLRNYVEKGNYALGVEGVRPRGQVFEIDLCEYLTTELVLHGNVSPTGEFEGNIGHHIEKGDFNNRWVVHSMLWTPAGLKFYLDGRLIREWWDPKDIKSPNHTMNMFLGAYGNGGTVELEADYVRYYQWELEPGNELPNSGFEYDGQLFPWEGNAVVATETARTGKYGVTLAPGDSIWQYVYLEHSHTYNFGFWAKGEGPIMVRLENIKPVTGEAEDYRTKEYRLHPDFTRQQLELYTLPEYGDHLRTVKVTLINNSKAPVVIDDTSLTR